jgi:hypothetical protein
MMEKVKSPKKLSEPSGYVDVGPTQGVAQVLRIPKDFHYKFKLDNFPDVELKGVFDGDKLQVTDLSLSTKNGLNATQLIQIKLPELVGLIAMDAIPKAKYWTLDGAPRDLILSSKEMTTLFLAQAYWFHHLSWGAPRLFVMEFMEWSRNNTRFHLAQISKSIGLPEARKVASERQTKSSNMNSRNRK